MSSTDNPTKKMIIHRIIQPEFNAENAFVGFTNIILYDINHIMDVNVEHDDLYSLYTDMHPMFKDDNDQPLRALEINESIGLRIPERDLNTVQQMMTDANLFQNAPRQLGNLMAVAAEYKMIPHGNFAIMDARIYFHASTND